MTSPAVRSASIPSCVSVFPPPCHAHTRMNARHAHTHTRSVAHIDAPLLRHHRRTTLGGERREEREGGRVQRTCQPCSRTTCRTTLLSRGDASDTDPFLPAPDRGASEEGGAGSVGSGGSARALRANSSSSSSRLPPPCAAAAGVGGALVVGGDLRWEGPRAHARHPCHVTPKCDASTRIPPADCGFLQRSRGRARMCRAVTWLSRGCHVARSVPRRDA
eukprot:410948-Rhodomonas_salina.3